MNVMLLRTRKTIFQTKFGSYRRAIILMAAVVFLFMLWAGWQKTYAQGARDLSASLTLRSNVESYELVPYIYVTKDPGKLLTFENYQWFVEQHLAGNRGDAIKGDILNLGMGEMPFWIIFEVYNQSWTDKWKLSFGQHTDGRYGLLNELFVYDHASGTTYINTLKSSEQYVEKLRGSSLSLTIPRGEKTLIFAYIVPKPGTPATLAPALMTETAYLQKIASPYSQTQIVNFFLIFMAGFFLATLFLKKMGSGLLLAAYYVALLFLFNHQNDDLQIDHVLAPHGPGILLNLSIILGLFFTKVFLGFGKLERLQGRMIGGMAFILLAATSAAVFFVPDDSPWQVILMYSPPLVALLFLFLLSLARGYTDRPEGYYVALGWLAAFLGAGGTVIGFLNLFVVPVFVINAFWYGLFLQGVFFVTATIIRLYIEERAQRVALREQQEEQEAIRHIMASKEASENVRLLRMIEHEREVMNELREREALQNEQMRKAKEEADQANIAKSAFLAVVSHEIRTPMTGIMGMVRLLLETKLDREQKDYTQTLMDSGDAMMSLLNDILDFEKIESGKMDLEHIDFDLHRLINGIKTLMSGHAEAKNIYLNVSLDPEIPRYIIGDPVRLRQVILNLTGNSIKFTTEGGVTIQVKRDPHRSDKKNIHRIRFSIQDTGIGISKEAQQNLFNPFSQADASVSRKFGGTGLGLAISQKLIEAMGGRIEIDSTEGHGSTFFFTITAEEGSAEAVERAETSGYSVQKPEKSLKILIVEDNEINQKLLKELVDRMGHETSVAGSGEDALKIVESTALDMILMDVQLPGITGMGATKAIRAMSDPEKAMLPVIALTGNVSVEDVRACYAANMNGHLSKPVDPKKLKDQIAKVIDGKLDNPVELPSEGASPNITMTKLDVGTDKFGGGDSPFSNRESEPATLQTEDDFDEQGFESESEPPLPSGPDVAPITALAMEQGMPFSEISEEELDEDSFETALSLADDGDAYDGVKQVNGHINKSEPDVFDRLMLENLRGSIGEEKFHDLMDDMLMKSDEIVQALNQAADSNDLAIIKARAHELKGMTGNFGLTEISRIAAETEAAAKAGRMEDLRAILPGLPSAQDRARATLREWLES